MLGWACQLGVLVMIEGLGILGRLVVYLMFLGRGTGRIIRLMGGEIFPVGSVERLYAFRFLPPPLCVEVFGRLSRT